MNYANHTQRAAGVSISARQFLELSAFAGRVLGVQADLVPSIPDGERDSMRPAIPERGEMAQRVIDDANDSASAWRGGIETVSSEIDALVEEVVRRALQDGREICPDDLPASSNMGAPRWLLVEMARLAFANARTEQVFPLISVENRRLLFRLDNGRYGMVGHLPSMPISFEADPVRDWSLTDDDIEEYRAAMSDASRMSDRPWALWCDLQVLFQRLRGLATHPWINTDAIERWISVTVRKWRNAFHVERYRDRFGNERYRAFCYRPDMAAVITATGSKPSNARHSLRRRIRRMLGRQRENMEG